MKKLNIVSLFFSLAVTAGFSSCNDFLDENNQNGRYDGEIVWDNPKLAEGVLLKAYQLMVNDYTEKYDYGTDDMVTNISTDSTITMATGGWTSRNSPFANDYSKAYQAIMHINDFLANMEKVDFKALQGISGINVSAEDAKKGITMAQMELVMKAAGFKEVK